ncbi:MAG: IS200/IS605 family transposase [Bacteroidetes bacterium]|nr:IS200/IS605 family transposase [Bacteroidota bacterium]
MQEELLKFTDDSIRLLCEWKQAEILELNVQADHIHLVVLLQLKLSVSEFMGIVKGKTAIKIFKSYPGLKKKPYWGNHFLAKGYCSSALSMPK